MKTAFCALQWEVTYTTTSGVISLYKYAHGIKKTDLHFHNAIGLVYFFHLSQPLRKSKQLHFFPNLAGLIYFIFY